MQKDGPACDSRDIDESGRVLKDVKVLNENGYVISVKKYDEIKNYLQKKTFKRSDIIKIINLIIESSKKG